MKKLVILILGILLVIIFIIYSNETNSKAPSLKILYKNQSIDAILGSHSWINMQYSYKDPKELVNESNILTLPPKSTLTLNFKDNPSSVDVTMYSNNKEFKQEINNYKIIAPESNGQVIYYVIATFKQGIVHYAFWVNIK